MNIRHCSIFWITETDVLFAQDRYTKDVTNIKTQKQLYTLTKGNSEERIPLPPDVTSLHSSVSSPKSKQVIFWSWPLI